MPVSTTVIPELSLVLRTYIGRVTYSELQTAIKTGYSHPEYHSKMAEIDDLLNVGFVDVGFDEAMTFAKKAQAFHMQRGYMTPHCFLVSKAQAEKSVAMFEVFSEMIGSTKNMFVLPGYPEVLAVLDLPDYSYDHLPAHCRRDADLL